MKTAGIICEYNPFHLGHRKQFDQIRAVLGADTAIVCLMSGNYVQRGQPAVFDKMTRAAAAVECGASLVLELPATHALRSAEGFARGGVDILTRLGAVDALCFGCESGDGAGLLAAARAMKSPEYEQMLRDRLALGLSYPAARAAALEVLGGPEGLLRQPNDILAAEYCKALLDLDSPLRPVALLRQGSYHAERADPENPSATAVRALLPEGAWRSYVPRSAAALYETAPVHDLRYGQRAMLARLRGMSREEWENTAHGSEGLWSKVWRAVQTEATVEAILTAAKSKRYPRTRLQRLLLCAYLGIDTGTLAAPAPYMRILAFDERGRGVLRKLSETSRIPLVHTGQTPADRVFFEMETRWAGLYALFSSGDETPSGAMAEKGRVYRKSCK